MSLSPSIPHLFQIQPLRPLYLHISLSLTKLFAAIVEFVMFYFRRRSSPAGLVPVLSVRHVVSTFVWIVQGTVMLCGIHKHSSTEGIEMFNIVGTGQRFNTSCHIIWGKGITLNRGKIVFPPAKCFCVT